MGKPTDSQLRAKANLCAGCYNNFYNNRDNFNGRWCWSLAEAKKVKRVRVSINQRPPYDTKTITVFNCKRETGYALLELDGVKRNNDRIRGE